MHQRFLIGAALACLALTGCASQNLRPDARDPLERMNRATFAFNEGVDKVIGKPVARTYRKITPRVVRTGVTNFWENIGTPSTAVNQLLQGKWREGGSDTARFLLNTVAGIGGIFDPATAMGLEKHEEDFGQTFGKWGIGSGAYVILPIFGPSSVRDTIALFPERYVDPINYIERDAWRWSLDAFRLLDGRYRLLPATDALEQTYDKYGFLRNAYFQQRAYAVSDGNVAPEDLEEGFEDSESTEPDAADPASGESTPAPTEALPPATPPAPVVPTP